MMTYNDSKQKSWAEAITRYLGVNWEVQAIKNPSDMNTRMHVSTWIQIDPEERDMEFASRLGKVFTATPYFKDAFSTLEAKNKELEKSAELLKEEVERLQAFETHYRMQYIMQHGKVFQP